MNHDVFCACGHAMRPGKYGPPAYCPACGRQTGTDGSIPSLAPAEVKETGVIVYGFDPPPAPTKRVELAYQAVLVAEEQTTPTPRPANRRLSETTPRDEPEIWERIDDIRRRTRKQGWPLEKSWLDCLAFSMYTWPWVAGLGFGLTILTGIYFTALSASRHDLLEGLATLLFISPLILALLSTAAAFLTWTMKAAADGEVGKLHWPITDRRLHLRSTLAVLLSVVAGPLLPLGVGFFFWLHAGALQWVDFFILFQLGFVAVGYGFLVFAAVTLTGRFDAARPAQVLAHARSLGIYGILGPLVAVAIFLVHGWFGFHAIAETHRSAASGILVMFVWIMFVFFATFLCRWIGMAAHQKEPKPV